MLICVHGVKAWCPSVVGLEETACVLQLVVTLAREMSMRPKADPAALCRRYLPGGICSVSRMPYTATGLICITTKLEVPVDHLKCHQTGRHSNLLSTLPADAAPRSLLLWLAHVQDSMCHRMRL